MKKVNTYQELPDNYWRVVERYLPGYTQSEEVLRSDILTRYIEDEEVCEEDLEWLPDSKEEAKRDLERLDLELYNESVEAREVLLKRMWKLRKACESIKDGKAFTVRYRYSWTHDRKDYFGRLYDVIEICCERYCSGMVYFKVSTGKGSVDVLELFSD